MHLVQEGFACVNGHVNPTCSRCGKRITRVFPCAGDSDADAFANSVLRLTAALKTEIELALPTHTDAMH